MRPQDASVLNEVFFTKRSLAVMPPGLVQVLGPVLEQIAQMTLKIKQYDRQILELAQSEYSETQGLPYCMD